MATTTTTITATATPAVTLSNPLSVDELQLLGAPTINIPGQATVDGLVGLEQGLYVMVEPTTSATDNGLALQAAYATAKAITGLTATTRASVILPPGRYTLASDFNMDTAFVDIVGMGGRENVRIDRTVDTVNIIQSASDSNLSNLYIAHLQNSGSTSGVIDNCLIGWGETTGDYGLETGDSFDRTFVNSNIRSGIATIGGIIRYCTIYSTGTLDILDGTSMSYTTVYSTSAGDSIDGASAIGARIYHCSTNSGIGTNITNFISTPYNVEDTSINLSSILASV